jgi:molybdopterin/thiamine biosynthesis adenylyltransferase
VDGQRRLASARVLVVGVGALGGSLASSMVRAGVGFVRIVDRDDIEVGNLQRQSLYDEDDVAAGLPKAVTAARKLARANSSVRIEAVTADVSPGNIEALVKDCSLVLDGSDNVEVRLLVNDACLKHSVPWIYGAVIGTSGCTYTILPGEGPCFRCIVSQLPAQGTVPTTETAGVLGMTPQAISALQAAEAIKLLTGHRADLVRGVRFVELWEGSSEELTVAKGPVPCPACDMARYEYLDQSGTPADIKRIGRIAFQLSPFPGRAPDLAALSRRLAGAGKVTCNDYLLRLQTSPDLVLILFADGRMVVRGTEDEEAARAACTRFFGS